MSIPLFAVEVLFINEPTLHTPILLETSSTIGQFFTAGADFNQIDLDAPTWGPQTNSIFTFTIYKDGPKGKGLYTIDILEAVDNATIINLPTIKAGVYYVEMSKADGDPIGWWTATDDIYDGGSAFIDGEADETMIEN